MEGLYKEYHGEYMCGKYVDQILREYYPDFAYKGVFFDVGAFEPIRISNSHHFYMNGWNVYSFEANPNLIEELKKHRQNVYNYAIYDEDKDEIEFNVVNDGNWTAGFSAIELSKDYETIFPCATKTISKIKVPQKTLNTIINTEIPDLTSIDIMSIDIEGGELKCLKGFDLNRFSPKVMVIENVTNDINIKNYLEERGYRLDKQYAYNQFYIKV